MCLAWTLVQKSGCNQKCNNKGWWLYFLAFYFFRDCVTQGWTSSRTHFEVPDLNLEGQVLGLEASSLRKLACPRLENSTIFWMVKFCRLPEKFFSRSFFKNLFEDLFFIFWRTLAFVSLVFCLEHSCPWRREGLSSERLSLVLASDFFVSLASSLVSSTSTLV